MKFIDGRIFKRMVISACNNLYNHYPEVDALNVFPVPDGDTGMNMNLTMTSGMKEIANRNDEDLYGVGKTFSRGLLMGARGNSGVITSQIFRGFTDSLQNKSQIDAVGLAEAFDSGRKVAYKAVIKPVEGTILTVIREASAKLLDQATHKMTIEQAEQFEEQEQRIKQTIMQQMKDNGIKQIDNEYFKITYVPESISKTIDTARLKAEEPELAEKYLKEITRNASLRITIKE